MNHLNYFSIVVLLFYVENKTRYVKIKSILKTHILEKFESIYVENRGKTTELTLLFMDLIVCPYLDRNFKNKLFNLYGIDNKMGRTRTQIINFKEFWFTKWTDFDFRKELEAKKSKEVY
jgi:viroplasmin and RNaseH domain-containing protein